ncbi:MAG: ABC transporter permease subunit, partial [Myxococcaceae bacterium]
MKRSLRAAVPSLLSILLALVVCFLAIALTRNDWLVAIDAYVQMLWGGIGDFPSLFDTGNLSAITRPLGESGSKAAILLLTGLSVAVAFKVGLFNIGAQGQLMWGGLFAAVVGAYLPLPEGIHPLVCLVAAAFAGAVWAIIPTALKVHRGVHEVISTIMMNWIAVSLVENWLVTGPLKAGAQGDNSRTGTEEI